jgi:lipopolysaccharide export system ATP-binding protein
MDNAPFYLGKDILVAENIFLTIGGRQVLNGATIRAEKGSITGLLGRNGAGKSTMLQSIFGVRSAEECDVFLNGSKIRQPYSIDGLLNYLPQKPFLPAGLTLKEIAARFMLNVKEMVAGFPGMEQEINKKVSELSGGTERLFSVLLLLLADTRFTFLDEPFSHIMPLHLDQLKAVIAKQKEKKGIIITDHMYRHLLEISDIIYLVKEGNSILIREQDNLALHGYISSDMLG